MVTRDHGGNLDWARDAYGGEDWIDLSTGINPVAYPVPALSPSAWAALPTASARAGLIAAAAAAYGAAPEGIVPLAGAQAAIQLYPRLARPGLARVLGPTYNEHAASLQAQGWRVETVRDLEALAGADMAVVVNPNNPDGRHHDPQALDALQARLGLLVVDESFADPVTGLTLAGRVRPGLLVLRSFGKFYGLAGIRLGFAIADAATAERLAEAAGPWAVSGPALEIGTRALADTAWQAETVTRLAADTARLDGLARAAGWTLVGGGALFRTYATPDARATQDALAARRVWTRRFPYSATWLRLGLPAPAQWDQLAEAMAAI